MIFRARHILCGSALVLAALSVSADDFKAGAVTIGHSYARATAAGQTVGGSYFKLQNKGGNDRLVAASAKVSASVEIHEMKMEGDVMRMRQVDGIALPAGQTVELRPGGLHLMIIGLKAPLKAGDKFPMKLRFEKAGEVEVMVNVEAPAAAATASGHQH